MKSRHVKRKPEPKAESTVAASTAGRGVVTLLLHSSVFAYDDARLGALVRGAYIESRSPKS